MDDDGADALWRELRKARERLILHYAPLVRGAARRAADPSAPAEESSLVDYGMFGLIEALDSFVPGPHGSRFDAYAVPFIEAAIDEGLRKRLRPGPT